MREIASVEKVLNSRCSCDFDGNPRKGHWGTFVEDKYPSTELIERVLRCCRSSPQFSDGRSLIWFEENRLFLGFETTDDPFRTRLLHIESGMQHEAVYLACTALGLGTCIHNLGINGTKYGNKIATASHIILENVESYDAGKFTTATLGPEKPFKKGRNIVLPRRNGNLDCLRALEGIMLSDDVGTKADEKDLSQMLWAAKGRTPHYIKSHPWGLTIPTWGGGQDHTSVYLAQEGKLFRYINWTTLGILEWAKGLFPRSRALWWTIGNPTHDLRFVKKLDIPFDSDYADFGIVLCRNEKTNRALWEVGYMLENMFLQAKSLGISYRSKVFPKDETMKLERSGVSEAVAALFI